MPDKNTRLPTRGAWIKAGSVPKLPRSFASDLNPSIKGLSPLNKNNRTMRGQPLRRVAGFASDLVVATARQTRSQNRKNFFDQIPPFFHFCAQSESLLARRRARLDSNAFVDACFIALKHVRSVRTTRRL